MYLASGIESEPHVVTVRRRGNVRAERALLLDLRDDLVIGNGDDVGLWIEGRADIAVFAVRREDLHARTTRRDDAGLFCECFGVEHGDVVLPAYGNPTLPPAGLQKRLYRHPP